MSDVAVTIQPPTLPPALAVTLGAALIALPAGAYVFATGVTNDPLSSGLIGGLLILTMSLAGLIIVASSLGISSRKAALGLPHGSVRSLLALGLLVVFVFIASWSVNDQARRPPQAILTTAAYAPDVAGKQLEALRTAFPPPRYAVIEVPTPNTRTTSNSTAPAGQSAATDAQGFAATVTLQVFDLGNSQAYLDLKKQVVSVLSTLLVSVVSFYFGGKAAADASGAAGDTLTKMKTLFDSQGGASTPETVGGASVKGSASGGGQNATDAGLVKTPDNTSADEGETGADCVAGAPATSLEATKDAELPAASGGVEPTEGE